MTDDPVTEGLRSALDECGLMLTSLDAQRALGRLAGLQLASQPGLRAARRVLAHERSTLVRRCVNGATFADWEPADKSSPP